MRLPARSCGPFHSQEVGWPLWSAGAAALYATELAASHVLANWTATRKMDEHGGRALKLIARVRTEAVRASRQRS